MADEGLRETLRKIDAWRTGTGSKEGGLQPGAPSEAPATQFPLVGVQPRHSEDASLSRLTTEEMGRASRRGSMQAPRASGASDRVGGEADMSDELDIVGAANLNQMLKGLTLTERLELRKIARRAFEGQKLDNTFAVMQALLNARDLKALIDRDKDFTERFLEALRADLPGVIAKGEVLSPVEARRIQDEIRRTEIDMSKKLAEGMWEPRDIGEFLEIVRAYRGKEGGEPRAPPGDVEFLKRGRRQIALVEELRRVAVASAPTQPARLTERLEAARSKEGPVIARLKAQRMKPEVLDTAFTKILEAKGISKYFESGQRRSALAALVALQDENDKSVNNVLRDISEDKRSTFLEAARNLADRIEEADQFVRDTTDAEFVEKIITSSRPRTRWKIGRGEPRLTGDDVRAVMTVLQQEIVSFLQGVPSEKESVAYVLGKGFNSDISKERIIALAEVIKGKYLYQDRVLKVEDRIIKQFAEEESPKAVKMRKQEFSAAQRELWEQLRTLDPAIVEEIQEMREKKGKELSSIIVNATTRLGLEGQAAENLKHAITTLEKMTYSSLGQVDTTRYGFEALKERLAWNRAIQSVVDIRTPMPRTSEAADIQAPFISKARLLAELKK